MGPTPWLRPPTPTSQPQLPPTSPPQSSRPPTLLSQSSRTSPPTEPRPSTDPSEPTRPSASQSFMRPEPTPSRPLARLSTPQSTPSPRSQLPLMLLPQLLPLPQLPLLLMLLPQLLLPVLMLLPQLSLLTVMPLLSQLPPLLLKFISATALHKYLKVKVIGLWLKCPAETDTENARGSTCPCWLLSLLSCRHHKCNVLVMSLQYDPNTSNIKTSGIVIVMLNVLIVRYCRE